MYDELVKRLRSCPDYNDGCKNCQHEHDLGCRTTTMREAADAIEEMRKCLDGVSADNDSLCKRIEELNKYAETIRRLECEGWYLQKTKFHDGCQAVSTRPLPEPPKEE